MCVTFLELRLFYVILALYVSTITETSYASRVTTTMFGLYLD